jgi:predicted naringenin-chalcone synthase
MLLFGDGASAALVSADSTGIALDGFHTMVVPDSGGLITWTIGDQGFRMFLSGQVPVRIQAVLQAEIQTNREDGLLRGRSVADIALWAVHGGGRTVLDAVSSGLALAEDALQVSRSVLHDFGNMSSCTIMFVLARMLASGRTGPGMAMAFGPGMVAETFAFHL